MYGLSCKRAKQLSASDYGYQKLAKRGLTPGEMLAFGPSCGERPDDARKRHPLDFLLWGPSAPGEPTWRKLMADIVRAWRGDQPPADRTAELKGLHMFDQPSSPEKWERVWSNMESA